MIGETYFQLRSRLDERLQRLSTLLRDLNGEPESQAIIANLSGSLHEPFVFVIVGECKVGKSTFLNALFGQEFSQTKGISAEEKILLYKFGTEPCTVPITPALDEVQVPATFLRDFHIVDTPGTNRTETEHQEITDRFVPISDLVVFVINAMNPWGGSAWQFLDNVHRHWMRNVLFVLQQSDLRTPEEMNVIIDYMKQLLRQRHGRDFPIFPVSAKKAYLARSSGIDRETLMRESGFIPLEAHITEVVERNTSRIQKLLGAIQLARKILASMHDRISAHATQAQRAAEVVREMNIERELQIDRTFKKILPGLDATQQDYQESCMHIAALAEKALSIRQAFVKDDPEDQEPSTQKKTHPTGANRAQTLDHRLFQNLQHRTEDHWRQFGLMIEEDCLRYDRFLHHHGRGTIFPPDEKLPTETDPEIRRIFGVHIDSTIRRFVLSLKLDEILDPGLRAARRRARWVPWLVTSTLLGTGLAGYHEGWAGAGIAFAVGALLFGITFFIIQHALQQAKQALTGRLDQSSQDLNEMLTHQIRVDMESFFGRFLEILEPAREVAFDQEQQMLTQIQRLDHLIEEFESMEREVHAFAN
jgi:GTPase Era involved in 16S rRNA processing